MKATIVADLSDPDEKEEYEHMMNGSKYFYILTELKAYIHQEIADFEGSDEFLSFLEKINHYLSELCKNDGITIA